MMLQKFTSLMLVATIGISGINGENKNIQVNNSLIEALINKSRDILKDEDLICLQEAPKQVSCVKGNDEFLLNLKNGNTSGWTNYTLGSNIHIREFENGFYKVVLPLVFHRIQIKYEYENTKRYERHGLITAIAKNMKVNIRLDFKTENVPILNFNHYFVDQIRNIDIIIEDESNNAENICSRKVMRKFFEFVIKEDVMKKFLSSIEDSMNYHLLFRV